MTCLFWYYVAPNMPTRNVLLLLCIATEAHYLTYFWGALCDFSTGVPGRCGPAEVLHSERPAGSSAQRHVVQQQPVQTAHSLLLLIAASQTDPCPCEQNSIYSPAAVDEMFNVNEHKTSEKADVDHVVFLQVLDDAMPPLRNQTFREFTFFLPLSFLKQLMGTFIGANLAPWKLMLEWLNHIIVPSSVYFHAWVNIQYFYFHTTCSCVFIYLKKTHVYSVKKVYLLMPLTRIFTHW